MEAQRDLIAILVYNNRVADVREYMTRSSRENMALWLSETLRKIGGSGEKKGSCGSKLYGKVAVTLSSVTKTLMFRDIFTGYSPFRS